MVFLIFLILLVAFVFCFYLKVKFDLKNLFYKFFGTTNITDVLKEQEYESQETPKTLFGMESIYMPTVLKDFPDLNINELKAISEDYIIKCLNAIEKKDMCDLKFNSEKLNSFITSKINDLGDDDVKYDSIKIHKTILHRYEKSKSIATLKFQTALEYRHKKNDDEYKKIQDRFITEFIYIIDERQVPKTVKVLGLNCPNCGASVVSIGEKYCNYCGSGIKDVVKRVWILNNISQI